MRKFFHLTCICILFSFFVNTIKAQTPAFEISLEEQHEITDDIFGHFLEKCSWGGEIGGDLAINPQTNEIVPEVYNYMKQLDIPNIRYPGGIDVDYFPWYELIDNVPGHHEKRPPYTTRNGERVVSDNRMGLDEFLQLCEDLTCEPILVVNLGDAFHGNISIEKAAQNAAGMVAYCNAKTNKELPPNMVDWPEVRKTNGRETPYNVTYFEVGNEPWQYSDSLNMDHGSDSLVNRYLNCLEAIIGAMKAMDSDIKIITDGGFADVNKKLRARLGDSIDYLAYHPYLPWNINVVKNTESSIVPIQSLSEKDIWKTWVSTPTIEEETGYSSFVTDTYYKNAFSTSYPVAVTEWNWNGWFGDSLSDKAALESRYAKGIGAAGFIHAMMRQGERIKIGNQSMLVGQNWGITGIRVDENYETQPALYPTAHITGFYSKRHGNTLVQTSVTDMPFYRQPYRMGAIKPAEKVAYIDALTTRTGDSLYFHAINRYYDQDVTIHISFKDAKPGDQYKQYILNGYIGEDKCDNEFANCSFTHNKTGKIKKDSISVKLPKHSVNCIVLPLKSVSK